MKLYVYDHCPYCVKARMIFALHQLPVILEILPYDDEATPIAMIGQKMAPILQKEDGSFMPESMDIVHYIEQHASAPRLTGKRNPAISAWLQQVMGEHYLQLLLPRFAQANFPEFTTPAARRYFHDKKQAAIGSLAQHLSHSQPMIQQLNQTLQALEPLIVAPTACNGELSEDDIHLFPTLRSLSIIAGVEFPPRVTAYLSTLAKNSNVTLLTAQAC